jgi:hypothetical protein
MNTEQLNALSAEFALVFGRYRQTDNFDSRQVLLEEMLRILSEAKAPGHES